MSNNKDFFKNKCEWSKFKDKILSGYLKPYFQKISTKSQNTIYIDGFAGAGLFEDGSKGSPLIALDILDDVEKNSSIKHKKIFPKFIEKYYSKELIKNLINKNCEIFNDDYKSKILTILNENINKNNIFLYVDPFGIKNIDFNVFKLLAKNNCSSELLLNLNSFGFIREGCRLLKVKCDKDIEIKAGSYKESGINDINNMNKIADGEEWQQIINKIGRDFTGKEAEKLFVKLYLQKLGKIFKYVFSVPIRLNDSLIPKYQIIYATNNYQGAFIMSNNMLEADNEMTRMSQNGQISMFDYENNELNIEQEILSLLSDNKWQNIVDLSFILFNTYKIYYTKDVNDALKNLERNKLIEVERIPSLTPTGRKVKSLDVLNNKYKIRVRKI